MVEISESATDAQLTVLSRPNRSMSWLGTVYVIMLISLCLMIVAIGFTLIGAWPVIIFAIATIICLSLGFQHVMRHGADFEQITLKNGRLLLETQELDQHRQLELNGHWVRVEMHTEPDGQCSKLALRSHGREIMFGRHLCGDTKLQVGQLLKSRLGVGFNNHGLKEKS